MEWIEPSLLKTLIKYYSISIYSGFVKKYKSGKYIFSKLNDFLIKYKPDSKTQSLISGHEPTLTSCLSPDRKWSAISTLFRNNHVIALEPIVCGRTSPIQQNFCSGARDWVGRKLKLGFGAFQMGFAISVLKLPHIITFCIEDLFKICLSKVVKSASLQRGI